MMSEEDTLRKEQERQWDIAHGLRLPLIDSIPFGYGAQLVSELKEAYDTHDTEKILAILKKIGDTMHSRFGLDSPTRGIYDEEQAHYVLYLSTGTGGTRLFINTKEYENFCGDLIFPNVYLDVKVKGRTLADVFEELFGDLAVNVQDSKRPYYVVKIQ